MSAVLDALVVIAAVIVVAEGLNKLDRADPLEGGLCTRDRASAWLKGLAWLLLTLGAGIYLFEIVIGTNPAGVLAQQAGPLVLIGFAVLIVRTRVKEG
jgi:hypothetical protein